MIVYMNTLRCAKVKFTQPDTVLHLDRLEKAGTEAEKPDTTWRR